MKFAIQMDWSYDSKDLLDLDCLDLRRNVKMGDLVKELARVLAGLKGSKRAFKSAVLLHLAFLDYRYVPN